MIYTFQFNDTMSASTSSEKNKKKKEENRSVAVLLEKIAQLKNDNEKLKE